jgi:hypothetical protein
MDRKNEGYRNQQKSIATRQNKQKQQMLRRGVITLVIILILFILFDISPFGGSLTFYHKWIECGRKPVKTQSLPGRVWYEETQPLELVRSGYETYYCTPLEAEKAGYSSSSNSYDFPHLHQR